MMRIKLFGLFIAFALLALVRPRKCLELLEAADAGAKAQGAEVDVNAFEAGKRFAHQQALRVTHALMAERDEWKARAQECPLPPAGWRCTRRAGHDGPCAAVEV